MIKWIKRVLFGLSAACIALVPQFYSIYKAQNRYELLWSHTYYFAIVTAVFVLAAIFGAAYCLVYYVWKPVRVWRYICDVVLCMLMYFLLARTGIAFLDRAHFLEKGFLSMLNAPLAKALYYVLLPLPVFATFVELSKRALRRMYALLAPAVLFVLIWPLSFETYVAKLPDLPPAVLRRPDEAILRATTNVYVFIFDEWSYARTFPGDKIWAPMTNLAALARGADVYERATTPASFTRLSMPRFLFQNDPQFCALSDGQVLQTVAWDNPHPGASLMSMVDASWFRVAMSFYLDFPTMFVNHADYAARVYGESHRRYDQQVMFLLRSQVAWISHFGVTFHQFDLHPSYYWINSQSILHLQARRIIEDADRPTMAIFHYCLPHAPFAWNRDGRKIPTPSNFTEHTAQNYQDNLLYLDRVIGEIVESLKRAGKYDSSLLICTSDHSWRFDPDSESTPASEESDVKNAEILHVPLIVKRIGQTEPVVVTAPMRTMELYPIIARAVVKQD